MLGDMLLLSQAWGLLVGQFFMIQVFWVNAGSVLKFFKDFVFFVLSFVGFILLTTILLFL